MPIRESQRKLYPPRKEWLLIRRLILLRAKDCCECMGECGLMHWNHTHREDRLACAIPNGAFIARRLDRPAEYITADDVEDGYSQNVEYATEAHRVVLTIGHLNHNPSDNHHGNLRAWCQLCHLRYDRFEHAKNARSTRRSRKAAGELPGV